MPRQTHTPVLKDAVINALKIQADDLVVDATYGRGGHARAILARLGNGGRLLAIDRDPDAIDRARCDLGDDARVEVIHAPFSTLGRSSRPAATGGRRRGVSVSAAPARWICAWTRRGAHPPPSGSRAWMRGN